MKERKYKDDWYNEVSLDDRGKEKRTPVYRGAWFRLPAGQEKKALLPWACVPWMCCIALILLYFRLDFPGARMLYVFLPAALTLFPGLYWLLGIVSLFRAPQKMTRLQKENSVGRILRSAAGCTVCLCAALLGDLVLLCTGVSGEWPGTLMLLVAALTAFTALRFFRAVVQDLSEEGSGSS